MTMVAFKIAVENRRASFRSGNRRFKLRYVGNVFPNLTGRDGEEYVWIEEDGAFAPCGYIMISKLLEDPEDE